ncbi:MAG: endonuclease/exonuclease/phosphatase family protein [Gammaproteobacteria bacterium]
MARLIKTLFKLVIVVVLMFVLLVAVLWLRAFKPADTETVAVTCAGSAPVYGGDSLLKVLSYNVQYMASKEYIFFYDIDQTNAERVAEVERAGKTLADKPELKQIKWTIEEVANIIEAEQPDVVMLQEINTGADSRTHFYDQIEALTKRLGKAEYPCRADATYWQAEYILHPSILGAVDMRLLTLSRYRMTSSTRHQLPRPETSAIERPFYFQRAILESRLAHANGSEVAVLNTHFEAWGAGTGVMQRQVSRTVELLSDLDAEDVPWVLGGDLNLLPPDNQLQRTRIRLAQTGTYDEEPAIRPLYDQYGAIPSREDLLGDNAAMWYTHMPNDPTVSVPDRTIDYVFYSGQWQLESSSVLHGDTWEVSDHLPVIGTFSLRTK